MLMRRLSLRPLSTTAAVEEKAPRSRLLMASSMLTAVAAPSAALLYYTVHRFAEDSTFRNWMRRDVALGAQYIEEIVQYYFPRLNDAIRIEDDWEQGENDRTILKPCSSQVVFGGSDLNLGRAPVPRLDLGNNGTNIYRKLNQAPSQPQPLAERARDPTTSQLESKDAVASSAIGAAVSSGIGMALVGHKAVDSSASPISATNSTAGTVPPDDPLGEDPVCLFSPEQILIDEPGFRLFSTQHSQASGNIDSSRWCVGGPAEPGAWAESPPPELPTTLEVPVEVAARFEATLLRYELAEASLSCQDGTRVREAIEALSNTSKQNGGVKTALIGLPERFWDHSFASEQTDLNAAKLSGKEASRAWRDLRLQWLRVQESFFQAELAGIESRIPAIQQRSRLGYGGGNALQHMQARKRQLEWKLLSIQHEKRMVKRAPWLEHSAVSDPSLP